MANLEPNLANILHKLADIAKYAKSTNYLASMPPIQAGSPSAQPYPTNHHPKTHCHLCQSHLQPKKCSNGRASDAMSPRSNPEVPYAKVK